jgi:hypothetical protein
VPSKEPKNCSFYLESFTKKELGERSSVVRGYSRAHRRVFARIVSRSVSKADLDQLACIKTLLASVCVSSVCQADATVQDNQGRVTF